MGKEIENAFSATTQVLLGEKLSGLASYKKWLKERVKEPVQSPSVLSGKTVYSADFAFYTPTLKKMIKLEETDEAGKLHVDESEVANLTLSNAAKKLSKIDCLTPEAVFGTCMGMEDCVTCGYSNYCFSTTFSNETKYAGYCLWPRNSEYVFGSVLIFSSKFCIKCYYSQNLNRCLEVSNSISCTDCYFCHNCENVHESMFCFNAKNLRHAIGNHELGKEEYLKIKKLILAEMAGKLIKNKSLDYDIYNIACWKKRR